MTNVPAFVAPRPGSQSRFPHAMAGGVLVWLLLFMVLLLAAGAGFYWYKYSTQNETLAQREVQLGELEKSFELLRQDLQEAQARTAEAEQRIQTFERRVDELQQKHGEQTLLQAELADLQNHNKDLKARLDLCQEQAKALGGRNEQTLAGQRELQAAMASLEAENQQLLEHTKKLQATVNALEPENRELQTTLATLEDKAADSEQLRAELRECTQSLEAMDNGAAKQFPATDATAATDAAQDVAKLGEQLALCQERLATLQAGKPSAAAQATAHPTAGPSDAEKEAAALAARQRENCDSLAEEIEQIRAQGLASDQDKLDALRSDLQLCRVKAEELEAKHRQERQMTEAYEDMIKDLKKEIQEKDVVLQRVRDRLEIKILGRILFALGSTHITPQGHEVLDKILPALQKVENRQIFVVGHTDDVGIAPHFQYHFPSNWELSAARAARVVRFVTENSDIDPARLAAVGVAFHQPEASNETPEGRARNRRVEIVVGAPFLLQ